MSAYLKLCSVLFIIFSVFSVTKAQAQQLTIPDPSPMASVSQRIALTDVTIDYHRPGVKEREVWGKLVPNNAVWRAGANENTTIKFSDEVTVNGNIVPAGTYGLHMIPSENEWTVILSKNYWSWGSFFYKENEDALRFKVKPETAEHQEWLSYSFENLSPYSADVVLHWEKLKIPVTIEVDKKTVAEHFKKNLDNLQGFFWQPWNQAANYAYQNEMDLDQAMEWADHSISINRNFQNLWTKANLLEKKGNTADAENLRAEAMTIAQEADINTLGYQYLFANKVDKAIELFQKNVKDYPDSWNVYDSLGEGYAVKGETGLAVKNYKIALDMVKDDTNKNRIKDILKGLDKN